MPQLDSKVRSNPDIYSKIKFSQHQDVSIQLFSHHEDEEELCRELHFMTKAAHSKDLLLNKDVY